MPSESISTLRHVLIGGYTAEGGGSALGISSLLNTKSSGKVKLSERPTHPIPSPTWLLKHPAFPLVFAASEGSPATVSSLRLAEDGGLTLLSAASTGGDSACHLALTPDGHYLIAASYATGSLATFAVAANGTLSNRLDLTEFSGSGPNRDRQAGPHAHQVVFDGAEILVCDLGADYIHRLVIDADGILLPSAEPIRLPAGSGPRHLVVVDDFLVVACELSGELWLAQRVDTSGRTTWQHRQTVATSTRGAPLVQPSGIISDELRIYVANRGVDTIGVFDLDVPAARLVGLAEFDSGGAWPRAITIGNGLLWVCNQDSDLVSLFEISPMPPAGPVIEISAPSPACVLLIDDASGAP